MLELLTEQLKDYLVQGKTQVFSHRFPSGIRKEISKKLIKQTNK